MAKAKAVVLLSGGLDSSTVLACAKKQEYEVYALSFKYGQQHEVEIEAAKRIAAHMGVAQHLIAEIDLEKLGGSALTDDIEIPKGRLPEEMSREIPVTYVPARNTIFLSYALAWAEVLGADDIFIGVNAIDYSGYPDCRPAFIEAFQNLANLATRAGVAEKRQLTIHTPLIELDKSEIIRLGLEMGVDYSQTITCYDPTPEGTACAECDACLLRLQGFSRVGVADPITYQIKESS